MRTPLLTTLVLAAALAIALCGCSLAPRAGEPLAASELTALVEAMRAAAPDADGYRGTGDGEISVTGRTLKVAFAVVYERSGWLRADLRPQLGTLGASLTALGVMEDGCARMFFPARLLVVKGCVSDVAGDIAGLDPSALVLGLPDAAFISELTDVKPTRRGDRVRLDGRAGDAAVSVEIDEKNLAITAIELTRPDSDESMRLTYSGHGWKSNASLPKKVELTALEGTSDELGMTIHYDTLKGVEQIDREKYELVIPEGVLEIDWRDLSIWR